MKVVTSSAVFLDCDELVVSVRHIVEEVFTQLFVSSGVFRDEDSTTRLQAGVHLFVQRQLVFNVHDSIPTVNNVEKLFGVIHLCGIVHVELYSVLHFSVHLAPVPIGNGQHVCRQVNTVHIHSKPFSHEKRWSADSTSNIHHIHSRFQIHLIQEF